MTGGGSKPPNSGPADDWLPDVVARPDLDQVSLEGLVGVAVEQLGESRSTWGRPDLVIAVAALLPPHAARDAHGTRGLIEALVDQGLTDPEVVELTPPARTDNSDGGSTGETVVRRDGLPVDRAHDRARYSTLTTIGHEVEVLDFATQPGERGLVAPDLVQRAVAEGTLTGSLLSQDQRAAVQRLVGDGAALSCLVGPAGTGKTTTIAVAADLWREAGYQVRGLAVSAAAAGVLGGELRAPADTVAKLLYEHRRGPNVRDRFAVRPGEVLIVDEASMLATSDFAQLTRIADAAQAKVVAVGDYRQLGAVDAGGLFRLLANDTRAAELSGMWRFHHQWERVASIALRDRNPAVADTYAKAGRLHHSTGHGAVDLMVARWARLVEGEGSVVMLAHRVDDTAALAFLARRHLVHQGVVEADGMRVGEQTIGVGDQVVTTRNQRQLVTDRGMWVRNGDRWTVTHRTRSGALDVIGERGALRLPAGYVAEHVALGYALTVHKAQGMTVDHGLVLVDNTTSAEALYVGMTRGRDTNEAFVRTDHPDENPVEVFRAAVGRDTTELSALGCLRRDDPDHANEREAELRGLVADIPAVRGDPADGWPHGVEASVVPEVGIDDGADVGW